MSEVRWVREGFAVLDEDIMDGFPGGVKHRRRAMYLFEILSNPAGKGGVGHE